MKYLSYGERAFLRGHLNRVRHVTLDPDGPGVVRIHLIPCTKPDRDTPFVAILNGQDILPLNLSWAILLTNRQWRLPVKFIVRPNLCRSNPICR